MIGALGGKERQKGIKNVSEEIMAENLPNPKKEVDIQVLKAGVDMLVISFVFDSLRPYGL